MLGRQKSSKGGTCTKAPTCSRGGHLNSLVFLAATADGKSDCLISIYLLNWSYNKTIHLITKSEIKIAYKTTVHIGYIIYFLSSLRLRIVLHALLFIKFNSVIKYLKD